MPADYRLILAPQLGVNDKTARIVDWHALDGAEVKKGVIVCSLETTKALYDVESEFDGYLRHLKRINEEVEINHPIAVIFNSEEESKSRFEDVKHSLSGDSILSDLRPTAKATKLAKQHGIDMRDLGLRGIIKEKDVSAFIERMKATAHPAKGLSFSSEELNVVIYGSGRGGSTVLETLLLRQEHHVVCFVDDDPDKVGERDGKPVLVSSDLWTDKFKNAHVAIALAIADSHARSRISERARTEGFAILSVIHPSALISPSAEIGTGCFIKAGAIIETKSVIGDCCIIDNGVTIAHDNVIGEYCHLAPGVSLGSGITIGRASIIGIGSSISTGVAIGANCIVSVGSAVTRNAPDNSIMEGVPASIVGRRKG